MFTRKLKHNITPQTAPVPASSKRNTPSLAENQVAVPQCSSQLDFSVVDPPTLVVKHQPTPTAGSSGHLPQPSPVLGPDPVPDNSQPLISQVTSLEKVLGGVLIHQSPAGEGLSKPKRHKIDLISRVITTVEFL